ncbi:MAG: 2,3-dehydroadipyl-CoA hydratase, partial [Gammaproteobacteria bacterium]
EYVEKIAKKIARNAPFAVRQAKQSLLQSQEVGQEDGLKFERQVFSLLSSTDDKQEGIAAFKEKRHSKFTGK